MFSKVRNAVNDAVHMNLDNGEKLMTADQASAVAQRMKMGHKTPGAGGAGRTKAAMLGFGENASDVAREGARISDFATQAELSTNAERLLKVADAAHVPSLLYTYQSGDPVKRRDAQGRSNTKPQAGYTRRQSEMRATFANFERGPKRQSTALMGPYRGSAANYEPDAQESPGQISAFSSND